MLTDLDSFAEYGITEANIQYIFDLAEQLITTDSDKSLRIDISEALDEKTSKRERVAASMRSIALRSKAVFGASSAKARVLNAGNISQIRDAELELTARKLHADASAELDALSAEGLTQAYLDKFEADINAFAASRTSGIISPYRKSYWKWLNNAEIRDYNFIVLKPFL